MLSTGCVPHPGSFEPFRDVRGAGCGTLRVTQLTEAVNYPEKLWVSNCDESLWSLLHQGLVILHTDQALTLQQPSLCPGLSPCSDPKSFVLLLSQRKNRGLVPHGPQAAQERHRHQRADEEILPQLCKWGHFGLLLLSLSLKRKSCTPPLLLVTQRGGVK